MARATIIVDVNEPAEIQAAADWLAAWGDRLTYRSENLGCGCCIDVYNIEAPDEAVDALPRSIRGASAWVDKGIRS